MTTFIALLRGINVTGRKRIVMSELRQLCAGLGYRDVQTYIQSGNIVFSADGGASAIESGLEHAIKEGFGLAVPVVVRTTKQ